VREHALTAHDLIYPVFVTYGSGKREAIASMPGVERLSLNLLLPVVEECVKLGIPVMALFPVIDASLKTADGREALNPQAIRLMSKPRRKLAPVPAIPVQSTSRQPGCSRDSRAARKAPAAATGFRPAEASLHDQRRASLAMTK
jgi:hypothetical protein